MRPNERLQAGFTLALSLMVTAVIVMLAAGLMLRIVNDVKGAKMSSQAATLTNDADVALSLAEAEVFQDIDLLHSAIWAATMSDIITWKNNNELPANPPDCPETPNSSCVPGDVPRVGDPTPKFPLRELQLLGNSRNWPAFADWSYYLRAPAYSGGYLSLNSTGSSFTTPAVPWNWMDSKLTRGWWRLPRNNSVDNDYYFANSVTASSDAFPVSIAGEKTVRTAVTSYGKDASVTAVTHNYFYQELFPIRGKLDAAYRIPVGTIWPNAEDEYGVGNGLTASGSIAAVTRYVWDTPFYKKIYKLQSNRKVAVYVRLDLRDYFAPDPAAPVKDKWTQPDSVAGSRSKDNFLKFFLAAVPEGRLDAIPGENKQQYFGAEIKTKYILIKTGGMRNLDMAGLKMVDQTEDRQYPAVLQTSGGLLRGAQSASEGFGQDVTGIVFRADGNRGFNWSTLKTRTSPVRVPPAGITAWTPVASERYVYFYEKIPGATSDYLIYASYPPDSVDQGVRGAEALDMSAWQYRRVRKDTIVYDLDGWLEPVANLDATVSLQSSFSAIVNRDGTFVISAASGCPCDCDNYVGGDCLLSKRDPKFPDVDLFWRGPVASRTYYAEQFPAFWNRSGLPFSATPSAGNMR